jgi:hypothetical protein
MFAQFLAKTEIRELHTLLDVGVTSDRTYDHSNYIEAWYPYKSRITAAGIDPAEFLEWQYPGVRFICADGRDLPFEDNAFDFVHSSAVLEHVGSKAMQARFLHEMWRVARRGIFMTTPNRWFPIEFHTLLPVVHWLPSGIFRNFLKLIGRGFFADEANLNLLTRRSLLAISATAGINNPLLGHVSLFGWPTNLLLFATKQSLVMTSS